MSLLHLGLTMVVGVLTAGGVVFLLLSHRATLRHFAPHELDPLPEDPPPVALLKAIEGADDRTIAALASFCDLDYPGPVDYVVGTIEQDDPVVEVVHELQQGRPETGVRTVFGELFGANRKTSIMDALAKATEADLLVFSDGDTLATRDYLRHIVPDLVRDEVGCVTCLPRPVDATTIGGKLIALHYVTVYILQWMAAQQTTGIHFALGKTMAQRRDVLDAYGGFHAFPDALADDYELGDRAAKLGKRVVVARELVGTLMPREDLYGAFRRLLRWMRTIRRCRPGPYLGLAFTHPVAFGLVLAVLNPTATWPWLVLVALLMLRIGLAAQLYDRLNVPGWKAQGCWLPLLELLELLAFGGAFLGNTIVWRGRRYLLKRDGNLQPLQDG